MSQLLDRYDSLKKASQLALNESETLESMMGEVLTKVVHETIKRYQDKVAAGIEDSVSDLLDNFKRSVAEDIFRAASTWKVENKEPALFPKGCRYAYTCGDSTIFVVEQDPGIRSLVFDESVVGESFENIEGSRRLSLALPYVVFLTHFHKGILSTLYCGWRKAPLRTMEDMITRPMLPNIHTSLAVCMDNVHSSNVGSFSEVTTNAINHFWSSRFNNDVSENWWNKDTLGFNMSSGLAWQEASEEDSMWVLDLDYPYPRSVQSVINLLTLHETEPDENAFRHLLSERIDDSVKTLFYKVSRYFKKTKFEKYYPTDVTEPMKSAIIQAVGEFSDVVFTLDKEISELSKDLKQKNKPTVRAGNFWTKYVP